MIWLSLFIIFGINFIKPYQNYNAKIIHNVGSFFIRAIYEEVDHWYPIKADEQHEKPLTWKEKKKFGWKPLPNSWLKCDIAFA